MISKEFYLKNFSDENINEAIKVYEDYKLSYEKDISIFSNIFCSPNIWSFFQNNYVNSDFVVETNGVFNEADRRIIAFNNKYNMEYPIHILEIKNKSNFGELKHKDYLGAILALGIERNKIGDILVKDRKAYVPIIDDISKYIINNLTHIGKSPVEIKLLLNSTNLPSFDFEELTINVSKLRLDSIISKITNISRTKAIQLIDTGKVLVNYTKAKDKSQEVWKGTKLTIRGNGKYILGDIIGETRSGKKRVLIKKYI